MNISNILKQQISERQRGSIKPQKAGFKRISRMKPFMAIGIVMFVLLASIVSATLVLQFFSAQQVGNVPTPGTTAPVALFLSCKEYDSMGEGDGYSWIPIGSMVNLSIPIYLNTDTRGLNPDTKYDGIVTNGETNVVLYKIENFNTHAYKFIWNVTGVATDPEDPYYGFTYGIRSNATLNSIDGQLITINPGQTYLLDMWYKADPYYQTPPSSNSTVNKINFESWIIN